MVVFILISQVVFFLLPYIIYICIYTKITSFVPPFVFRHLMDCGAVSFIGGSLSRLSVSVTICVDQSILKKECV